ncbi:MAG: hypothetical protein HOM84_02880 [Thiotrichales bacterium]|jgi:hypothetical protein|nr:hypothetical protein [Thiotrichales bacterium]MBT3613943.1 hypothetical protein [Thiotrichales bacterium]MBT3752193.1 hypothetical protein [Thiotrichales bacterium]MBT3836883.1 hypothetical protein [Thiotrichales bacterium]MBT4151763.1 hypothetical protein [Thiotrichales bacterium]
MTDSKTDSTLCPFARAILNTHSHCRESESFHIAERHGVRCASAEMQRHCQSYFKEIKKESSFALGVTKLPQQMTSNMGLQMQCGAVEGLRRAVKNSKDESIIDTIIQAEQQFGSTHNFPYQQINQAISSWKSRKRGRRFSSL